MTARESPAPALGGGTGFERVARASDIAEGTLATVQRGRDRICLFRHAGRIGATAELCTHQAFPMAEGTLEADGTIECAWHGARFDCASGEVRQGPAPRPLPVFEVRLDGDRVMVGPQVNQEAETI